MNKPANQCHLDRSRSHAKRDEAQSACPEVKPKESRRSQPDDAALQAFRRCCWLRSYVAKVTTHAAQTAAAATIVETQKISQDERVAAFPAGCCHFSQRG